MVVQLYSLSTLIQEKQVLIEVSLIHEGYCGFQHDIQFCDSCILQINPGSHPMVVLNSSASGKHWTPVPLLLGGVIGLYR